MLKHDNRIVVQVAQVDLPALGDHLGVLPAQQPTDVAEEKSPVAVVRVGIGVRELVVDPVVPSPLVH